MPRNHNQGTLRNRNRITPKTRLRIIHGNVDADPVVLEEDEEKARVVSTAGVDAEDANEHHLQAVLTAASHRHHPSNLRPRADSNADVTPTNTANVAATDVAVPPKPQPSDAYIPVPDATGVVADKNTLYPPDMWKDPTNYARTSDTVDEAIDGALNDGYTYYMDERDYEWVEKNNEEARGEGTSAQGAVSGAGNRSRGSKAKGKEPDVPPPVAMTEDEFELVMGVFEKVTHDKTEHLHLSLETGMDFPAFAPDYEDAFSHDLPVSLFSAYELPSWIPPPAQLVKLARAVYPYWKERRIEREGHRVLPAVNFDESDIKNESYVCFRRREVKSVRKTRASQVAYSDKLLRMQNEFGAAVELAQAILDRELVKKKLNENAMDRWNHRVALVDLKRKVPSLGSKEDEELFFDKEHVPKKPRPDASTIRVPQKLYPPGGAGVGTPTEHVLRPSQRAAQIQAAVEKDLARLKEKDKDWEDALDNPYQNRPVPYAERFFKYIAAPTALSKALVGPDGRKQPDQVAQQPHALRLRLGRGGRLHLDRRRPPPQAIHSEETHPFLRLADSEEDTAGSETGGDENADEAEEVDEYREMLRLEVEETRRRMQERWRFDDDDGPAVGPLGSEEQDRVLYDDYQGKHIVHMACLFKPVDWEALKTDISIAGFNSEGRPTRITPEAIKISQQPLNRPPARHMPPPSSSAYANAFAAASAGTSVSTNGQQPGVNGTPISTMKRMPPPSLSQMRISFNGGIARPGMQPPAQPGLGSPVRPMSANGVPNGAPNGSPIKSPAGGQMVIDGDTPSQDDSSSMVIDGVMAAPLQQRPKSLMMPNSFPSSGSMPNGFPTNMSGITNSNAAAYISHTGPNGAVGAPHQMQDLKSAFANVSDMAAMTAMSGIGGGGMGVGVPNGGMSTMPGPQPIGGRPGFPAHVVSNNTTFHLPLGNNNGFNLKLPPTRQTQWSQAGQPGHGPGPMSGFMPGSVPMPNMQTMQTMQNGSPSHAHAQAAMLAMNGLPSPARTPSANRMRANIGPDAAQMLSVTQGGVGMGVNINGAPLSQSPLLHAQAMQTVQRSPHMHAHAISPMPMSGIVSLSPHHSPMRLASSPVPPSPLMQAAAPAAAPLPNTASGY